jgi:hypothetical protein
MESHVNTYKLNQGNKEYILTICTVGEAIKITCKNALNQNISFSRNFTIDEIKRLDQSFSDIRTQLDALEHLDNALKIQKVGVSEEGDIVKINFYVTTTEGENREIPLGDLQSQYIHTTNTTTTTTTYDMNQNAPIYEQPAQETNQYFSEYNAVDNTAYNTDINTGFDTTQGLDATNTYTTDYTTTTTTNQYTTDDNANQYTTDFTTNQYTTDVNTNQYTTDDNVNQYTTDYTTTNQYTTDVNTNQYTTDNNYNQTDAVPYTTGVEDLTSQFATTGIQDTTTPYTNDIPEYTGPEYTGATEGTTVQFNEYDTTTTTPYTVDNNNQYLPSYQTTTETYETTNIFNQPTETYEKPYITPADELEPTIGNVTSFEKTTTTTTTNVNEQNVQNVPDERLDRLGRDTMSLKNEHQLLQDKINALTGEMNDYKTKLALMEKEKAANEVNNLKAENRAIKQQLSELNNLRNDAAEVRILKSQLSELDPLRRKAAEMDALKSQLNELNALRAKVAELERAKSQLGELDNLRAQVGQMNAMKQQLGELNSLRQKVAELNNVKSQLGELNNLRSQVGQINILKQQIEELTKLKVNNDEDDNLRRKLNELENIKMQYEQEIRNLRETNSRAQTVDHSKVVEFQKVTETRMRNTGMDSKQLFFEDKPQQICVKGDIIHNTDELELITRKINKSNQKLTLNLLYKATADSDKAEAFHAKCDDAKSTLVLVETDKGKRFGGYTNCSWDGDCVEKKDEDAFVFSLDKMQTYENIPGEDAIGCYPKFGPIFLGCQIRIYDNAFTKGGTTYEKGLNFNTEEDYELTGGERAFNVREIEVYEVIPQ